LFGQCGGCQFQQWDYAAQLRWKHAQVKKLFEAIAPGVDVNSVIASPRTYGYRSKITPHFEPPRVGDAPVIGFLRHNSRTRYVDVEKCPIAMEEINAALPAARAGITDTIATFKRGSTLLMRVAEGRVFTNHKDIITETVGDSLRLKFPAGGFFQNNPFLLPQFAAYAVGEARKGGATFLVDAYCGSGLFALSAAPFFRKVVGVELSEASVVQARENAQLNNVAHASFVLGDAARIFDGLALPPMETAVIIDPPRKGCDENFLAQLVQFAPVTIVYISCNPHTQARDLEPLLRAGYRVNAIQPFDLFPQTKHLECVVTLCVVR
ncbi:MAG: 50S ribosomal protein L11 methyltransferase, partial [Verrucomicrobiae bacterium]|nr:50S ribosomal protein L11 methyltransferase [Verrucomicrobiae bacterium]